jgi:hypothetical protein
MKGFSAQSGKEYRVTIVGEQFSQGSTLSVQLDSNHDGALSLILCEGNERKIKNKSKDAFKKISEQTASGTKLQHSFSLDLNSRITDKSGSLYLLYGNADHPESLANLKLTITPHPIYSELIEVFTHEYRFALKNSSMGKKGDVEFKLEPSGAKEWASLDQLTVCLKQAPSTIEALLVFDRTQINPNQTKLATQSLTQEFQRSIPTADCLHAFNGRVNKDYMVSVFDQVFLQYRDQNWLLS